MDCFLQGVGAGIMIILVQVLAFKMIKPKQRTEAAPNFTIREEVSLVVWVYQ